MTVVISLVRVYKINNLFYRKQDAASRPKKEFTPKTLNDLQLHLDSHSSDGVNHSSEALNGGPPPPYYPCVSAPVIKSYQGMLLALFYFVVSLSHICA